MITLENGIGHLAHAVDAPMVMIYSNIVPLGWANPVEASRCEVLYDDPRQITVDEVIAAADASCEARGAARAPRRGDADENRVLQRRRGHRRRRAVGARRLPPSRPKGHQVTVVCPWRSALYQARSPRASTSSRICGCTASRCTSRVFHALRRRNIDVLYCTVIGTFCEAQCSARWSIA